MPDHTTVLLMAYGSAPTMDDADIRAYLDHILQFYRQTAPTDDEVDDLKERYHAVGGSPLYDVCERVVTGLQRALDLAAPDRYRVRLAMKHSPPFIDDVVREITAAGSRGIGVALAPFRSRLSTEGYVRIVREAAKEADGFAWRFVDDWHLHPLFLDLWQRRIEDALQGPEHGTAVVFTNHSLPTRIREWNDPYEAQFAATAHALADRCGLVRWTTAFQSAGGGATPWLGPGLDEVLTDWAGKGIRRVLAVPVGFLLDHLEVRYDIDIAAQRRARELDLTLMRTRMPNDDPLFVAMLVDLVRRDGAVPAV